ncbi:hypothetical protein PMV_080 [Port-miou virus]|uniref:Uncharacterized protein n=1 Tax=Port-miou virus TaxID=1733873 RepID=A0A0N9PYU3_9VIRU|nr:hypothetical protein PMV_080 [Port-miou virus]
MNRLLETVKDFLERYNPSNIFVHQVKYGDDTDIVIDASFPDVFFYWTEHMSLGEWCYSFPRGQRVTDANLLLEFIAKRTKNWEEQNKVGKTD